MGPITTWPTPPSQFLPATVMISKRGAGPLAGSPAPRLFQHTLCLHRNVTDQYFRGFFTRRVSPAAGARRAASRGSLDVLTLGAASRTDAGSMLDCRLDVSTGALSSPTGRGQDQASPLPPSCHRRGRTGVVTAIRADG